MVLYRSLPRGSSAAEASTRDRSLSKGFPPFGKGGQGGIRFCFLLLLFAFAFCFCPIACTQAKSESPALAFRSGFVPTPGARPLLQSGRWLTRWSLPWAWPSNDRFRGDHQPPKLQQGIDTCRRGSPLWKRGARGDSLLLFAFAFCVCPITCTQAKSESPALAFRFDFVPTLGARPLLQSWVTVDAVVASWGWSSIDRFRGDHQLPKLQHGIDPCRTGSPLWKRGARGDSLSLLLLLLLFAFAFRVCPIACTQRKSESPALTFRYDFVPTSGARPLLQSGRRLTRWPLPWRQSPTNCFSGRVIHRLLQ